MAMGLKEKCFTFSDLQKIFLILHVLSDCPSLFNEKREKKKKMRASVILKLKTSKELLKVASYLYSL